LNKILEFKEVIKDFGRFRLGPISFSVNKGEIFGLIGPNGSGKTTTLKLITGLLKIDKGEMYFLGKKINPGEEEYKRFISYIPDSPFVYDYLSGYEYLLYVGRLYKIKEQVLRDRIDFFIELFGMGPWIDTLCEFYSHGMKQKISITSALVVDPVLLIIDEPLVALDPVSVHRFKKYLKDMKNKGKSILIATHTLSFAEEICDRVGILFNGKLYKKENPEKLKQEYETDTLENAFIKIVTFKDHEV
jgi:ABC-2 type transport system ATP-binding protein